MNNQNKILIQLYKPHLIISTIRTDRLKFNKKRIKSSTVLFEYMVNLRRKCLIF